MSSVPSSTDLLVFCALASECEAARKVFEPDSAPASGSSSAPAGPAVAAGGAKRGRTAEQFKHDGLVAYHGSFFNEIGEELEVKFISMPEMGARTTASMVPEVLKTFKPRWVVMTGICAGFGDKCNLGDVVVATRAVDLTQGGKETSAGLQVSAQHPEPSMQMRQWITLIEHDETWYKFRKLLHKDDVSVDAPLPAYWLAMFMLAEREDLSEAVKANFKTDIKKKLTEQGYLYSDSSLVRAFKHCVQKKWMSPTGIITQDGTTELASARLRCGYPMDDFPPKPVPARILSGVVITTPNVRTDLATKYDEMRRLVAERNGIAVETEIAAFMQVVKDYQDRNRSHQLEFLALKGVCDFGDDLKDDIFHHGAAVNSAAVLLLLARQHLHRLAPAKQADVVPVTPAAPSIQVTDKPTPPLELLGTRTVTNLSNPVRGRLSSFLAPRWRGVSQAVDISVETVESDTVGSSNAKNTELAATFVSKMYNRGTSLATLWKAFESNEIAAAACNERDLYEAFFPTTTATTRS
eukprot:TRINITY_DN7749_c0_g1_i2.p1 TRINITY_DN7749_c0_g1~~TRINITY_DN7749_c0_g1_i2.p1  ORF type:complete len:523 (-),score=93.80 TRINITY_DN7749_c0_g1_i2:69-1637(-)